MCDSTHCSANDRVGTVRSACPRRCRAASVHGFGLATARALFEDGARAVVTSRSSERAEELAAAYAIGIGCDLLAADGAARLFGESTKRVGKIDILVLNGPGPAPGTAAATLLDVAVAADGGPRFESARWELQGSLAVMLNEHTNATRLPSPPMRRGNRSVGGTGRFFKMPELLRDL